MEAKLNSEFIQRNETHTRQKPPEERRTHNIFDAWQYSRELFKIRVEKRQQIPPHPHVSLSFFPPPLFFIVAAAATAAEGEGAKSRESWPVLDECFAQRPNSAAGAVISQLLARIHPSTTGTTSFTRHTHTHVQTALLCDQPSRQTGRRAGKEANNKR